MTSSVMFRMISGWFLMCRGKSGAIPRRGVPRRRRFGFPRQRSTAGTPSCRVAASGSGRAALAHAARRRTTRAWCVTPFSEKNRSPRQEHIRPRSCSIEEGERPQGHKTSSQHLLEIGSVARHVPTRQMCQHLDLSCTQVDQFRGVLKKSLVVRKRAERTGAHQVRHLLT